ncbi:MAG: hypothetical protein A2571_02225 [Candidatus Vogelbacteria bacterium RIFOXYD1_FULL_44_32]|uniref:Uncharacterized protein n=1 Tax=Candidatus Vogelbacteria bacterium RIFOXYD1_FULL_44_32 TaxID=1802438 RepID=A0A1G2QDA1_9BACT|nr:MAG: hypothetical protein A2571_02225 [Candidatus Vogelbacteria bacterium RIFOXYD1_FULL_44_32]
MFIDGRPNLLVDVKSFTIQPEETEHITPEHEAMRANNGFALAMPVVVNDMDGYRIFPADIRRDRYYTHIMYVPERNQLLVAVGDNPLFPEKTFPIEPKEIGASWELGWKHLMGVCRAIRTYYLMWVAQSFIDYAEHLANDVARRN